MPNKFFYLGLLFFTMKTKEEKLKERLEEVLDEQFPKGECKERGQALVLFAEALNCLDIVERGI